MSKSSFLSRDDASSLPNEPHHSNLSESEVPVFQRLSNPHLSWISVNLSVRTAQVLPKGWPAALTPWTSYPKMSSAERTLQEICRTRVVQNSPHPLCSAWWQVHLWPRKWELNFVELHKIRKNSRSRHYTLFQVLLCKYIITVHNKHIICLPEILW